jgi:hypothetical protein
VALGVCVIAAGLLASHAAQAQDVTYDHLTCVNVNRDDRLAQPPPPLQLTPQQTEFLESDGCKIVGGNRIARAKQVCYATAKSPGGPPAGANLSGQSFLCYRVKCAKNGGGKTPVDLTDQFGGGSVTVNQQTVTKTLCVPAFPPGTPTPTPTVTPTPTASPTPVVTPTPPYGSASRAFVKPVGSLLQ